MRRGGFGGPDGLAAFLKDGRYDALIDATHPFAAQIAAHAAEAAELAQMPRVKLLRPPFERTPEDRFVPVAKRHSGSRRIARRTRGFFLPRAGARSRPSRREKTSGASSA